MISITFQKIFTMTTQEVADKFYELGEANQWDKIQDELFSDDAESIEPPNGESTGLKTVKGRAALKQKAVDFNNSIEEVYGGYSSKPVVGGNFFSVAMGMRQLPYNCGNVKISIGNHYTIFFNLASIQQAVVNI